MSGKRVLFVCSQNKLRSPTAEQVFASWPGIEVSSAGLNHDAEETLTPEMVREADLIFVMEKAHLRHGEGSSQPAVETLQGRSAPRQGGVPRYPRRL